MMAQQMVRRRYARNMLKKIIEYVSFLRRMEAYHLREMLVWNKQEENMYALLTVMIWSLIHLQQK